MLCDKVFKVMPDRYIWTEDSSDKFTEALASNKVQQLILSFENENFNSNEEGIDTMVTRFNRVVHEAADLALKKKCKRQKNNVKKHKKLPKWHDHSIIAAKRDLSNKLSLFMKFNHDPIVRGAYFSALKQFRKLRKTKFRLYKKDLVDKLDTFYEENPKEYWKLLEQISNAENPIKETDSPISHSDWFNHFKQLNSCSFCDPEFEKLLKNKESQKVFNELDFIITEAEISKALRSLKNNKASGFDGIINEMLKHGQSQLLGCLVKLFNSVLSSGIYPTQWGQGYINPLHKKGAKDDPANYRGITINSCVGKLFTKILNIRLDAFLEKNKIICDEQIGFTKDKRTSDHMFVLRTLVDNHTKKGSKPMYTCFIDFKGAFDSVWHQGLFFKLREIGVSDKFYTIVKNMYMKTELCVKANQNDLTDNFSSNIGVRQGDNLSPNLFKIFVNDFKGHLDSNCDPVSLDSTPLSCLFYADDLVLVSSSQKGLQSSLDTLDKYCDKWKLNINYSKTKCVHFNSLGRILENKLYIKGKEIENARHYCYLGVNFSASGCFTVAENEIYNKGLKAYFKFSRCFGDNRPKVSTFLHIFDHTVKSVLMYGSEIWGTFNPTKLKSDQSFYKVCTESVIEKLNVKLCKFILGVNRRSTNAAVMAEIGRFPLFFGIIVNLIKYWIRLEKSENHLLKEALSLSKKIHNRGQTSWISCIFSILKYLDLSTEYILRTNLNIKKLILKKLTISFSKVWKENLFNDIRRKKNQKNKLRTFRLFKNNFRFEPYLEFGTFKQRMILSKFRIGSHNLEIETGRHKDQPENERICKLCKTDVGDEMHFLLECSKLDTVRDFYLEKIFHNVSSLKNEGTKAKFIWILSNEDPSIQKLLSKMIDSLFDLRSNLLKNIST